MEQDSEQIYGMEGLKTKFLSTFLQETINFAQLQLHLVGAWQGAAQIPRIEIRQHIEVYSYVT